MDVVDSEFQNSTPLATCHDIPIFGRTVLALCPIDLPQPIRIAKLPTHVSEIFETGEVKEKPPLFRWLL